MNRMMIAKMVPGLLMLSLCGCATEYQARKGHGYGHVDVRISQETYTLRFYGNQYTEEEVAQEHCYRRAAELAVEQGYPYILVMNSESKLRGKKNRDILYTITVKLHKERPDTEKVVVDAEFYLYKYLRPK